MKSAPSRRGQGGGDGGYSISGWRAAAKRPRLVWWILPAVLLLLVIRLLLLLLISRPAVGGRGLRREEARLVAVLVIAGLLLPVSGPAVCRLLLAVTGRRVHGFLIRIAPCHFL